MSKTIKYQIEFFNYWHSGSGLSGTTYADNLVNKDIESLPYIPGKTLKGLFRDAAINIHQFNSELVTSEFINEVFGKNSSEGGATKDDEGVAFFGNGTLSKKLSEDILRNKLTEVLYSSISSTAIDEYGQAKDGSLRQLEVTIPISMYGVIENFPIKYLPQLEYCMGWIKQIGQNRNRGLGKCKFSIVK